LFAPDNQEESEFVRTFLHNPLHDYESVWWTAVWFVFYSEPEGVSKGAMKRAHNEVYQSRFLTFGTNAIVDTWRALPKVLKTLGKVLADMRKTLVAAYRELEKDFDGSKMLLVFPKLRGHLQHLAEQARDLHVKPPVVRRKLNVEGVKQLDAVEQRWKDYQDEEDGEEDEDEENEDGGTGGQPTDANPFLGVLGKMKAYDSRPEIHPALRLDRFMDEPTV